MLNLCEKFNALSCKKASLNDAFLHPNLRGDWYFVQINSKPEHDIYAIVSDIYLDRYINIVNGSIVRYSDDDVIDMDMIKPGLKEVVDSIENKVYSFLLFDNRNRFLFKGQPLIFVIDPMISRSNIPYHRHLNNGYIRTFSNREDQEMKESFTFLDDYNFSFHHVINYQVIPESICYIHDVKNLDVPGYCRQEVAYATMVGYAFRNEIFLKYYDTFGEFFWLGPETPFPSFASGHLLSVNQDSNCHCGSKVSYKDCHFKSDFKEFKKDRRFNANITEQMVIETQKHFSYNSEKLLTMIIEIIENSN